MSFKKIIDSNLVWLMIAAIFILSLMLVLYIRDIRDGKNLDGKDLRVALFGIEQILHGKSPYQNSEDLARPLYRYAPGFAFLQYPFLLKSTMTTPYQFKDLTPSIIAWYVANILALLLIGIISLKLIPCSAPDGGARNLKLSFLLSLPWIVYEVANGQNKIMALLFMVSALYLFERDRMFWSAFFFNLAVTIYVPLGGFVFYFLLRNKNRFLINFAVTALLVFVILPSTVWGFHGNLYLLKDWFVQCIKPFVFTHSYETYVDVRRTSQSFPSAIGRMFVTGPRPDFIYHLSPFVIHLMIKLLSLAMVLLSCVAIRKHSTRISRGLEYSVFLILALLIPQYCLCYTWSWLVVIYFALFNYIADPEAKLFHKKLLFIASALLVVSTALFSLEFFQRLSVLSLSTFILWTLLIFILIQREKLAPSSS